MPETTQRSVKVKILPDKVEEAEFFDDLAFSHDFFHAGVKYYQQMILCMRQDDVHLYTEDGEEYLKNAAEWGNDLENQIRQATKRNGGKKPEKNILDEVKVYLQNDITKLLKSNIQPQGKLDEIAGDKKAGLGLSNSGRPGTGLVRLRKFFENAPAKYLKLMRENGIDIPKKINKEAGQKLIDLLRATVPKDQATLDIIELWDDEQKKKEEKREAAAEGLGKYKKLGLLPLFPDWSVYYAEQNNLTLRNKGIRRWDYAMWSLAVATLRSWNTWNQKASEDRERLQLRLKQREEQLLSGETAGVSEETLQILKNYELQEHERFKKAGTEPKVPFRIGRSMIRGWEKLYQQWTKNKLNEAERKEAVKKWQAELKKGYGDVNLFFYLAEDKNKSVWEKNRDTLNLWTALNTIRTKLDHSRGYARCSLADSVKHPVWINNEFSAKGKNGEVGAGSNKPGYIIRYESNGKWTGILNLIHKDRENHSVSVVQRKITLAKSDQMRAFGFNKNGFYFIDPGTSELFEGIHPKGAKIQFSRDRLEANRTVSKNTHAYLNITWELPYEKKHSELFKSLQLSGTSSDADTSAYLSWYFDPEEAVKLFNKKKEKVNGLFNMTEAGSTLRLLSVDMGLRSFASCSVFRVEACKEKPEGGFGIELQRLQKDTAAAEKRLYAIHERSFHLALPGERPSRRLEIARDDFFRGHRWHSENAKHKLLPQFSEVTSDEIVFPASFKAPSIREMRQKINALRAFRRLGKYALDQERRDELESLIHRYETADYGWPFEKVSAENIHKLLTGHLKDNHELWLKKIAELTQLLSDDLELVYKSWLRSTRIKRRIHLQKPDGRIVKLGFARNSLWNIEYLQEVRRIKIAWNNRALSFGDQKGLNRGSKFDPFMLNHIAGIKDDRLKKGSDALIMAALGYEFVATDRNGNFLIKDKSSRKSLPRAEIDKIIQSGRMPDFFQRGYGNNRIEYGKWIQLYEPAQLILFEDLSRFKFSKDRPREENGMLMKWTHRAIPSQVKMQGEIHGIDIATASAEFTSRFHSASMAPGVRGGVYSKQELLWAKEEYIKLKQQHESSSNENRPELDKAIYRSGSYLLRRIMSIYKGIQLDQLFQISEELEQGYGYLLPYRGGEFFITLKKIGKADKPVYVQADINAAQSLARRWLTRYAEPIRIIAGWHEADQVLIPRLGKRLSRVLEPQVLRIDETEESLAELLDAKWFTAKSEKVDAKAWNKYNKSIQSNNNNQNETLSGDVEDISEEELETIHQFYSLFRDPSGIFFDPSNWVHGKRFWSLVNGRIAKALLENPVRLKTAE